MAGPKPVLYNGHSQEQSIWETRTSPVVSVGTRGSLEDGRVFYYARNSGIAIVAGQLLMSEIVSGDMDNLGVTATAVEAKVVAVTPAGTKIFAINDLDGGYMVVNDVDGEGITYKIAGNPVTVAATEFDLVLKDGINVALTANSQVTLVKNPWMDVVIAAAAKAHMAAGVSQVAVGAGSTTPQYFWCQTWGVSAGWDDASTAIGSPLQSGATAGQIELLTEGTGAAGHSIGVQLFTGVGTEYMPKFLQVAP
jgi:hypothetical protein